MDTLIIPKYCDANSILLVNKIGVIKKLYCPFRVKVIAPTVFFKVGMDLWVEQVSCSAKDELIYWVLDNPFSHSHFEIKATF